MSRLVWLLFLVLLATPLAGQKKAKVPSRPVTADPKSPLSYYRLAMSKMESDAQTAADALYWALELEPNWPEALYARRIAVLRSDPERLMRYIRWDKNTRREMAPIDSGYYRGLMQDPFVYRDLDRPMIMQYFHVAIEANIRRRSGGQPVDAGELRYAIDNYLTELMRSDDDPGTKGWMAFAERRFPEALNAYAKLIGKKHEDPDAHEDRATIFVLTQRYDSARAELEHALAEHKAKDDKDRVFVYQPKAMLQFKLATVMLRQNEIEKAKEALGQALVEDLAFFPAHLTLANLALIENDTATAGRELGLAVELKPDDPLTLQRQGELFLAVGKADSAVAPLTKVVTLKPYYARPHRLLGFAAEKQGDAKAAVAHYQKYLELAMSGDRAEAEIRQRIIDLSGQ